MDRFMLTQFFDLSLIKFLLKSDLLRARSIGTGLGDCYGVRKILSV